MDGASDMPYRAFSQLMGKDDSFLSFARKLAREKPSAALPLEKAPRLVTFADINDPKTVTLVDPANLAATFGPGIALKRIWIAITNESITAGDMDRVLGIDFFKKWGSIHNEALGRGLGDPFFDSLTSELSRNDFHEVPK
jgi:hypothetical protein